MIFRIQARTLLLVAGLVQGGVTEARAGEPWRKPLASRNQFPLALLFLSLEPERATTLGRGEKTISLDWSYSNILVLAEKGEESLVLDLESLRTVVQLEYGLGGGIQAGAAVPIFYAYGGFLDGFISGFHDALGIANSVRQREPEGLFRYQYRVHGEPLLQPQDNVLAAGDLTLTVKKALKAQGQNELAARAAVKLPIGSLRKVTGSGAADLALGLSASRLGRRMGGYFNLGYHILGDPDGFRARNYFSILGAADFLVKENLVLVLQADYFGPFLESGLPVLDRGALQAVAGVRYRASERFTLEWRFTEDLSEASPDFTIGFRASWDFSREKRGP